jgi:hypothetical protein
VNRNIVYERSDIIALNVQTSAGDKTDDMTDSFYEELDYVLHKFPKYCMKTLFGDFNARVDREYIFKPITENESLHEISNDNGVVNVGASKNSDDVNLLEDNIDPKKKNTETLIDASKEAGLEAKAEKTKYTLLSHHKNARQNHNIKIANRSSEQMAQFKYFGTTVTKQKFYY